MAGLNESVRAKVELWNVTFNISYTRFRERVAEISRMNHSAVEDATRIDWEEIPDGAIVLPVDDDDWFAPTAGRALEVLAADGEFAYLWDARWIEVPTDLHYAAYLIRRRLNPNHRSRWTCATNNYALHKRTETRALLGSHVGASRAFAAWLAKDDGQVKHLRAGLSVANRTLSSQTTLGLRKPTISRPVLILKFHLYKRLYRQPPPPELDWCRPYLAMMAELMDELQLA
ncbi:MAG: hypothetical protein JOZ73_11235 [Solirubrobacterales bacterium]|nr:hypothetical protein [Solirubrobacterales bacterium]